MLSDDLQPPTSSKYAPDTRRPRPYSAPFRQYGAAFQQQKGNWKPQPRPNYTVLKTCYVTAERKTFRLELQQNHNGRYLRITEQGSTRTSAIIVPAAGLKEFTILMREIMAIIEALPAAAEPPTFQ